MPLQLFAVYLGGKHPKANIEVHDLVFAVGLDIKDTFSSLKAQWFGDPKKLHIDSYISLEKLNGYRLELIPVSETATTITSPSLFFVNLGASQTNRLEELHESGFYVALHKKEAIQKAKIDLCKGLKNKHLDDCLEVDDCLEIKEVAGFHLRLIPDESAVQAKVVTKYIKIS